MRICPFCMIDEERQDIFWRGTRVYVIPSNPQLVPHHLLIVPERHVEEPPQLDPDECRELFDTLIMFQERIIKCGIGTGCDIRQHWRPFLPQSDHKVDHLHWHLLPRQINDALYTEAQCLEDLLFTKLPREAMRNEMALLRSQIFLP